MHESSNEDLPPERKEGGGGKKKNHHLSFCRMAVKELRKGSVKSIVEVKKS